MHQLYTPRLLEVDNCMEQIAVTAIIGVIVFSQFACYTVGQCKVSRGPTDIAGVKRVYGILEIQQVSRSVAGPRLTEYLPDRLIALHLLSRA